MIALRFSPELFNVFFFKNGKREVVNIIWNLYIE